MPRKHKQSMTTCPKSAEDTGIQVEIILPRPTRSRRQASTPGPGLEPAGPRLPRVTRLMALAIKFQDMVDQGEVRDYAELARLGYVTRARLTQIMNLLLLSPEIQERLLFLPPEAELTERVIRAAVKHVHWASQRSAIEVPK